MLTDIPTTFEEAEVKRIFDEQYGFVLRHGKRGPVGRQRRRDKLQSLINEVEAFRRIVYRDNQTARIEAEAKKASRKRKAERMEVEKQLDALAKKHRADAEAERKAFDEILKGADSFSTDTLSLSLPEA